MKAQSRGANDREQQRQPIGGPLAATRELFLRGLSICYFAAFASFLVQVPGLYGPQGIAPANDPDLMERQCLQGLALACLGICGWGNVFVMYGMLHLYKEAVHAAQIADDGTFYNFQWDILLLEVGFIATVLAPLVHSALEPRPSSAALWMIRFILFKLMLMSGLVKLRSGGAYNSWMHLSAVWYHFATQCIPTPSAWFFHNLPMVILKLFCAGMFVIEIPAAFLILVPVREVQYLAAFLQISLQVMIMFTGNYTFFNILTIFLACSLLSDDILKSFFRPRALLQEVWSDKEDSDCDPFLLHGEQEEPLLGPSVVTARLTATHGASHTPFFATAASQYQMMRKFLPGGVLVLSFLYLLVESAHYGLSPFSFLAIQDAGYAEMFATTWIPRAMIFMSLVLPISTCWDLFCLFGTDHVAFLRNATRSRRLRKPAVFAFVTCCIVAAAALLIFRGVICSRMLSMQTGVLSQVAPGISSKATSAWPWASSSHQGSQLPFNIQPEGPYGYGLFASMTGIGRHLEVARPELVLEVQDADKGEWHELQFRYKPGDVMRHSPFIAPYQPRLDWQMWFQALYWDEGVSLPWFQSLTDKILDASPSVLDLLDTSSLPDTDIKALRIQFFSYNFTHYGEGSAWWNRTPRRKRHMPTLASTEQPVNLAKAAQKASWTFHKLAVGGFLVFAIFICFAPYLLGTSFQLLWLRMCHHLGLGIKEV